MSFNSDNKKYIMSDADFCGFASYLIVALTNDLDDLSVFGLTIEKINELQELLDEFKWFLTDPIVAADVMSVTIEKNKLIEQIKQEIRNMSLRCRMKWGLKSLQEKSLSVKGMNNFSDEILLVASRRVHETMTNLLADLSDEGLTQAILDNLNILNQSYENLLNEIKNKINERQTNTVERRKKGNELYDLVSKYCKMGKNYYAMNNSAKYKRYLIYQRKESRKKEPVTE